MGVVSGSNSLMFATGIDNSGLLQGKTDAVGIIQSLGSTISKINPFAALAVGAVAAFTLIANQGYKMAKSFESAMAEVKTIANVSEAEFSKLEKSVFNIYKTLGTEPPDKLANGLYEIIGAGFEAGDALNILEIASKAATAGVTETAVASDGLTTILNAFRLSASDAQDVADIMFATVDRGKISFEELSSQIATVAPLAASSNISFEEVGAAISTLTKQGVPASVAMTQIRSAIIATNDVLGDGAFKTLSLQEGFQKMYEASDGSQNKLKELTGRVEAMNGILSIAGDNLKGAKEDLDAMANSAGSVDRSFKTITSTTENQWEIFGNKIKASTKGIGDAVLEMSNGIAKFLNDALDDGDKLEKSYTDQRTELFRLKGALQSVNVDSEERKKIVKQIIDNYPDYLKGIDAEKVGNEKLLNVLDQVNEAYKQRYKFEKRQNELNEALKKQGDIEITIDDAKLNFDDKLSELQTLLDDKGVKLNIDFKKTDREILKDVEKQLKDISGATTTSGFGGVTEGYTDDLVRQLSEQVVIQNRHNKELKEASENVNELTKNYDRLDKAFLNSETGRIDAINKIKNATNVEDLDKLNFLEADDLIKLIEERKKIVTDLDNISSISSEQYKTNKSVLEDYLNSENEQIKEAAIARKTFFELKPTGGGSTTDDRTETERFIDQLKERKDNYTSYENYVEKLGKEAADNAYENLLKEGSSYTEYLQRQLKEFENNEAKKKIIVDTAARSDVSLKPREILKPIETITKQDLVLDVKIDTTSIKAINRRLNKLNEDFEKAQTDSDRDLINVKIEAEKKKLKAIQDRYEKSEDLSEDFFAKIQTLSRRGLIDEKKILTDKLKALKDNNEEATDEYRDLQDKVRKINEEIGKDIASIAQEFSSAFSGLSDLFSKFGDEDTAALLGQLSGVADGIGQIASGNIIGGSLAVLNSAISVEVVSDTAKFETAIKELEKAIDKLDYVISKSVGNDKITGRKQAIDDLKELEKQAGLAKEAELAARKEVKFLGIRVGDKGRGSGTDPAKLEELEQKAEDARRKAQELREQLDELYTGTTQATIVDSIISGLKEGKRTVADFADNFKDLMQDAMLQAFQIKYLEKEIEKFYNAFADAGSDSNYTADEIDALRNLYNQMIQGAQDDLDAINQILEDSGIGSLGSEDSEQTGLAGGIEKITEDTANILAGTLNSIRIDVQNGLEAAQQSLTYLSQIAQNTSYNHHLEVMELRLTSIETLLS